MSIPNPRTGRARALVLAGVVVVGSLGSVVAATAHRSQEAEPAAAALEGNRYIGAKKCKSCHSKEEVGGQYAKWQSMNHSKAFETLASEEAIAIAAELEIAEPQKDEQCAKCHVTAHGAPDESLARGFKQELGVQCESCHGPGEAHMKARFAAAMDAGDSDEPVVVPEGEILASPEAESCKACHNEESPTYAGFCFFRYMEKVRHLKPGRTQEELDAILVCGCGGESCDHEGACPEDMCPIPAGERK